MKTCKGCGEVKPLDDFQKVSKSVDRYRGQCKKCCAVKHRQYRAKNKEKLSAYNRDWQIRNREHSRLWKINDRAKNSIKNAARDKIRVEVENRQSRKMGPLAK